MITRILPHLALVLACFASLVACGDDAAGSSGADGAGGGSETSGGEEAATRQGPASPDQIAIEDLLAQQREAVKHADGTAFAASFVTDVFVFGPFATQSLSGRDAVATAIGATFRQFLDPAQQAGVAGQGATYGFTSDRQGAWAFDVVAVTSRGTSSTFHVSTVLVKDGGAWKIAAQAWTAPVSDDLALPLATQGGWPDPTQVPESVGDGSQPVRDAVTAFLGGGQWPSGGRTDSMMIGTAPGEIRRGDAEIAPVIAGARGAGVSFALLGGVTTRVFAGGSIAFAGYAAHLSVPHEGQTIRLPVRVLDVFVRDGSAYRIVSTHVSLGAPG